ncbi:hypothetical protein PNQ29_06265 [Halobacterium salinarum]|uniref:capsular polysaccharide export protein, LipB/KpsS family n=1 Tax=Halobacterium salinarum TaxID=2242 RepID=UPI0025569D16|nr:hypothetical protein [Halobacterium salinarum]MDL0119335.1 hypothetical protein [Halobacterium salinarum]
MPTSIGFVSVTPSELNFQLQIGKNLDFNEIHYVTQSSIFEKFVNRSLSTAENMHYIEDFIHQCNTEISHHNEVALRDEIHDRVGNKQSFVYSDYRFQGEDFEQRISRVAKTNRFWRHTYEENDIDYIFSCSGGEYDRRCGFYLAEDFDTEFYFTYSAFPSKKRPRVIFEPSEMQKIIEGGRSNSLTRSEARQIINEFRASSGSEFERSIDNFPINADNVRSFFDAIKGEMLIRSSDTPTNFGWNICESISDEIRESLRHYQSQKLYLDEPPNGPFVVLALHSNQDAQITCREPRYFNNQFALVRAISNVLPYPCTLCVKQHPAEVGKHSPDVIRNLQSDQENVDFLNPKIPPSELFDPAEAIITIRSTIGLEALLHGCSVITFGETYYTSTGASISADFNNIEPSLLEAIQSNGPTTNQIEGLVSYLWENSYPGDTIGNLETQNISYLTSAIESLVRG